MTVKGKEFVKSFIEEGELIGSLIACNTTEPCTFNLLCLEDCSLLQIPFKNIEKLTVNNAHFSQFIIKGLINLAIKKERREFEFLCLTASERFALFKERSPNLVNRVTQNDIAHYLGITPVALSRIKAELKEKGFKTEDDIKCLN